MSYISLIYKNIYFRADYLIHYYSMMDMFRLWIFLAVHMEYMHVHKGTHAQVCRSQEDFNACLPGRKQENHCSSSGRKQKRRIRRWVKAIKSQSPPHP